MEPLRVAQLHLGPGLALSPDELEALVCRLAPEALTSLRVSLKAGTSSSASALRTTFQRLGPYLEDLQVSEDWHAPLEEKNVLDEALARCSALQTLDLSSCSGLYSIALLGVMPFTLRRLSCGFSPTEIGEVGLMGLETVVIVERFKRDLQGLDRLNRIGVKVEWKKD